MSIELGKTTHTGWYLLSGIPPTTPISSATQGGKVIPPEYATTFANMIVNNLMLASDVEKDLAGLTFGSTIYYFDHRKVDNLGGTATSDDGSGWNPSNNFMQNHWNIVTVSDHDWGTAKLTLASTGDYSYTKGSSTYETIHLDSRFGYWVYIVSNSA